MADVKRTRFYAESDGVMLNKETGEISNETVSVNGRFRSTEAAQRAVYRRYGGKFLPKNVRIKSEEYVMKESDFYKYAHKVEKDEKQEKNNK